MVDGWMDGSWMHGWMDTQRFLRAGTGEHNIAYCRAFLSIAVA